MRFPSPTQARPSPIMLRWEGHDRHATTTRLTLIGVPLAALLAVVGLPPIDLDGPLHHLGIMGPTCGMTRGVMWTARGELARAWQFNPASLLVIPTMIGLASRGLYGRLTRRWLNLYLRRRPWLWMSAGIIMLLLTIRQQLIAEFLLSNPAG